MYNADNTDFYPPNPGDGGSQPPGCHWCSGDVSIGGANEFDPQILRDPSYCLVASYLGGDVGVFRCPADTRRGAADGQTAQLPGMAGKIIPCARSVSMSQAVGTVDPTYFSTCSAHLGKPTHATGGPWLPGYFSCGQTTWATFGKATDFRAVEPSQIFLVADEDPNSINDASLAVSAGGAWWIDFPATAHDHGCTFSFCDGHAEIHKWIGNNIILTAQGLGQREAGTGADYADWAWMRDHTSRLIR
jgi:prepilin-type processing-associated H-X9-DG protein